MKRSSHTPMRTCAGCRTVRAKRDMMRIVRSSEGSVLIDLKGKAPGRGVYLCLQRACWERGLKRGQLEHALRGAIPTPNRLELEHYAESLSQDGGTEVG